MNKPLLASAILAILTATGCKTTTVQPTVSALGTKLDRGSIIYVATPQDSSYGGKPYQGSGATVASAFDAALSRYADSVIVGERRELTSELVAIAKEKKCSYLFIPKIMHWEDRATEWSGKRDRMELFVRIIRVEDGVELGSAEIKGKSAWASFGGDHPEDLVKAPVQEFVTGLF